MERTPAQYHAALKAVVKRAIIVLDAQGDSEMRFQNTGQVWNRAINDAGMAYGYTETRVRFIPTAREIAQADVVADWLTWLGVHHGGVPRLVSWAHDEPIWRMAERERCSERTIHYRIDRSIAAILAEFLDVEVRIPEINEKPGRAHTPNFMTERPAVPSGPDHTERHLIEQHGKVWIDGIGFMKNGRRINTGHDKITDRMLHGS